MSIPNTIDLIEEHIENAYDALEIGGADLTNINKNLTNINSQLIDRYKDYLANGTDAIWNNWEDESTQEGESLNFNNTIEAKIKTELKGNATQDGTPTPDTPQDIHIVTGDNTIKILGQQLFNANTIIEQFNSGVTFVGEPNNFRVIRNSGSSTRRIPFILPKGEYTFKAIFNSSSMDGSVEIIYDDDTKLTFFAQWTGAVSSKEITITTDSTKGIKQLAFACYGSAYYDISNFIVGVGNVTYEPYKEQTQLISLGSIELAKIGNYIDRIFKAVSSNNPLKPSYYDTLSSEVKASLTLGKWYVYKAVEKLTLNGTETRWSRIKDYRFNLDGLSTFSKATTIDYMCSTYECFNKAASNADFDALASSVNYGCDLTSSSSSNTLRIKDTRFTSLDNFKANLSTNNVVFYYRPLTPTTTEITDTTLIGQLENLEKIKSYNNQTNIFQENEDYPFIINATMLLENT